MDSNEGKHSNSIQSTLFFVFLILFVCCIIGSNRYVRTHYHSVTFEEEVDTLLVEAPHSYRGGTEFMEFQTVPAGSELVCNKDGWNGWNICIKSNPNYHNITHVDGPYYMYKAANNDTIVVIKDGCVLKFKMPLPDTTSRWERFMRD